MKHITIINAYGEKNIGDAAILHVALRFIQEAYGRDCRIAILCEDKKSISHIIGKSHTITPYNVPYGYAIRSNNKKASGTKKISRFITIYTRTYILIWINKLFAYTLPHKDFYSYITAIKEADVIIGMGGGYFTTNNRKDYFGLLLSLLPVYVSKMYNKPIIFLPMSFGPFATKDQERLAYNALKDTTIMARDDITLQQIKYNDKGQRIKAFYIPDLALFFGDKQFKLTNKLKSNYIVLTARDWFTDNKQQLYERSLLSLIEYVWQTYKLKTVFVPMARNMIEDDDNRVAKRLHAKLKNKTLLKIYQPKSLEDLQKLIGKARVAVCTRMHSAILATTTQTPFLAIGYGHKTLGFVRSFDIEKWHVGINDVNYDILKTLLDSLLATKNYSRFIDKISKKQSEKKKYRQGIINNLRQGIIL